MVTSLQKESNEDESQYYKR